MKKYLIFLVLVLVAVSVFLFKDSLVSKLPFLPKPESQLAADVRHKVVVEVELPSGPQKFTTEFTGEKTALEVTQSVMQVEVKGEGEMAFVTAINGEKADETKNEFWSLLYNGNLAQVGAGSLKLQNRDVITWKISTY